MLTLYWLYLAMTDIVLQLLMFHFNLKDIISTSRQNLTIHKVHTFFNVQYQQ